MAGPVQNGKITVDGDYDIRLYPNSAGQGSYAILTTLRYYTLQVAGDFGGGTITLQGRLELQTDFVDLKDADGNVVTLTASDIVTIKANLSVLRLSLSGSTSPDLVWTVQ